MTNQNHADRQAPESRDLALAFLAARLSELSEQVGRLASRVDAAEEAIAGQASILAETSGLAREVSWLSAAVAGQGSQAAGRPVLVHPRQPVWAAMNHAEYADALRGLARWVTAVLLQRYPTTGAVLPPCWPAHPAVVEELDWLHWDWMGWALEPDARSRDAADWHDRWLPGVLARIRQQLAACGQQGRHTKLPGQRRVPADLNVADHAPEVVFIEQMARTGRPDRYGASKPR
jgi:predicted transcriptional regulator